MREGDMQLTREYGNWLEGFDVDLLPGMTVIELGCGLGADARYIAEGGVHVYAMDRSLERLRQAAASVPKAHFVVADLAVGIPFRSGSADLVLASLSLHYFDTETTLRIVQDAARVLRSHGMILCRVNVAGERNARWGDGIGHEPDFFEVEPGWFKRFFTDASLDVTLSTAFDVERIYTDETWMSGGDTKRTLVARARRRD
jgi:SAM-dependent methyltransferase